MDAEVETGAAAHAWLAAIVESSDDAIVTKDLDGIVTSWNPAAQRMFGYSAGEIIGKPVLLLIPPDLRHEEGDILARVRRGQRIDHFETVRVRKDRSRVHVRLTISPVRDASGAVIGASKIVRDVAASRDADRAQAFLASIVESSDDAIISKDLDGVVTSWNRAAERLYGYTSAEMVGTSVLRIVPPELHDEEARILARIRKGERLEHFETTRVAKGGERIEVSLTVSPVRDAAGRIIGASKMARDLRSQREADRVKATLAAVVASSDDAIISKSLNGTVTSWNPAAERLYGYRAEEMVGTSIRRIIPPDLQSDEDHIIAKIRAGERVDHFETVRVRKDGRLVDVSVTVSPVRDSLGRVIGASKIARDITAQREAQRKKDHFLAVLAHELRNPLAPIRNAITLFAQPNATAEQRARVQAIAERQIQHMSRLLDDLLDVSRLSRGHVELKRERVELGALVENAIDATRSQVEERGHEFRYVRPTAPLWMQADPVRITQVVANLLTNAAKYTDPGGVIELAVDRGEGQAIVAVRDSGIGFEPHMKERLFTLFSQDERAVSRAAGGLGIGLALVREFVERHGGSVDAASPGPGKGSTFIVRLPVEPD